MNELAVIFDRSVLQTRDVLHAAAKKWNIISCRPGPVGGHLVGIDPYYLAAQEQKTGLHPE